MPKLFAFLREFGDETNIVSKLRDIGLLPTTMACTECGEQMRDQKVQKRDGIRFECSKRTCRRSKSIRVNSFFDRSKLSLCECMLLLHLWSRGYTEKLICDDYEFSNKTVVDWFRFCRELSICYYENDTAMIGGPGCVVELDETLVVKRKYNRGRMLRDGWLFGGIERRSDGVFNCFVVLVYDRSAAHLIHHIRQRIAPGTHIVTDGWPAYARLSDHGYQHNVVIHEENFIAPSDRYVHTQTIESTWCSLKRFLRSRGSHKGPHLLEYLCEYMFRRKFPSTFEALLNTIRQNYDFSIQ